MTPRLITCICVTEDRPWAWPWMLWNYRRQTWPTAQRELLVVAPASAIVAIGRLMLEEVPRGETIRFVEVPPGASVPTKRNVGMAQAKGTHFCWWDDDDAFASRRLEACAGRLQRTDIGDLYLPSNVTLQYLRLPDLRCRLLPGANGHGFGLFDRRVGEVKFDETKLVASDTPWVERVLRVAHVTRPKAGGPPLDLGFCLSHTSNKSQRVDHRQLAWGRDAVPPGLMSPYEWSETQRKLHDMADAWKATAEGGTT